MSIFGLVQSPLTKHRITVFRPGIDSGECHCGKEFTYDAKSGALNDGEKVCELSCSMECTHDWDNIFPRYVPPPVKEVVERDPCPECGGLRHKPECSQHSINKLKAQSEARKARDKSPCPKCGGPAGKIRGWKHKLECPDLAINKIKAAAALKKEQSQTIRSQKPGCPSCGGPAARARGFQHTAECPDSTANKLKAAADAARAKRGALPACPSCGGLARGRGYAHNENCAFKNKTIQRPEEGAAVISAPKATCPECHGTKRGRGFAHADTCSMSCKVKLANNASNPLAPKSRASKVSTGNV